MKKSKQYYLSLPWTYTIETVLDKKRSYYIIRVNELPGICTDAKNIEKGMKNIQEAILCAVDVYKDKEEPFPEPVNKEEFSGKITYRTNSERHYRLVRASKFLKMSLSKTIDLLIDDGLRSRGFTSRNF